MCVSGKSISIRKDRIQICVSDSMQAASTRVTLYSVLETCGGASASLRPHTLPLCAWPYLDTSRTSVGQVGYIVLARLIMTLGLLAVELLWLTMCSKLLPCLLFAVHAVFEDLVYT